MLSTIANDNQFLYSVIFNQLLVGSPKLVKNYICSSFNWHGNRLSHSFNNHDHSYHPIIGKRCASWFCMLYRRGIFVLYEPEVEDMHITDTLLYSQPNAHIYNSAHTIETKIFRNMRLELSEVLPCVLPASSFDQSILHVPTVHIFVFYQQPELGPISRLHQVT